MVRLRYAKSWHRLRIGALLCASVLGLAAWGCGGGSSGGGGASTAGGATSGGAGAAAATNLAQWQTAMAALAQTPAAGDPQRIQPAALVVYSDVLARSWPALIPKVRAAIEAALAQHVQGAALGGIAIQGVRDLVLDIAAPPAVHASAPAAQQTIVAVLPGDPARWRLGATFDVGGTVSLPVLGQWVQVPITVAASVDVTDIRIEQPGTFDLSVLDAPAIAQPGVPSIDLRLAVHSPAPIVTTIAGVLTQILDPIVRLALQAGAVLVQREVAGLVGQLPQSFAWGHGGPGAVAVAGAQALEPLAVRYADAIQTHHLPFGHLYAAIYDDGTPGQGNVVAFAQHGDSAIWTGHYLASEAYRYDATGAAAALAGARRVLQGFDVLLSVTGRPGLLARAAIPLHSPHAAALQAGKDYFVGSYRGAAWAGISNISRDQYIGTFLGLGQVMHRVPPLRAEAGALAARAVDYLEAHDWIAYRAGDPSQLTVLFIQSPSSIVAFSKVAALYDPARYGAQAASYEPLADMIWLADWISSREVHESYYKFNLSHATKLTLFELETRPELYRAYLRAHRIIRGVVAHHQNGWFDVVHAIALPPERAAWAGTIQRELDRAALRPRRGLSAHNSQDPAMPKAVYTTTVPNQGGAPGGTLVTQPRSVTVALLPVPIERRPASNFIWQRSPFQLDGSDPPTLEMPGTEVILPFWAARSHAILSP